MAERHQRAKRSSFIINLIQTVNGYSVVEGTDLLNKPEGNQQQQSHSAPINNITHYHNAPQVNTKDFKPIFKKINLIFVNSDHQDERDTEAEQSQSLETPIYCKFYTPWFNLNSVHEEERQMIEQWVGDKIKQESDLDLWIKRYKKHRNFMVNLYIQEYAPTQKYLSVSKIRHYICAEASWLTNIHLLLSNLGVININNYNFNNEMNNIRSIFKIDQNDHKNLVENVDRTEKLQQNQLLKRITNQIRPYCDYCRIHCGIVWFQHNRVIEAKQITNIMKNVNAKNPPLSQKQYQYILCMQCYCDGHFPLLLTHHDFKKVTANDRIEPNRKKNRNKRKKDKKRQAIKEKEQEGEEDYENRQNNEQERTPVNEIEKENVQEQKNGKEDVSAVIERIIASQQKAKVWQLGQTDLLLKLIEKYEQNWIKIHNEMKNAGYCKNIETEQLIFYFLSLPIRGVSKVKQQYNDEQFIESNLNIGKTNMFDILAEKKMEVANNFTKQMKQQQKKQISKISSKLQQDWKKTLDQFIKLQIGRFNNKLDHLLRCQNLVKDMYVFKDQV